jgi:hypothetical protein
MKNRMRQNHKRRPKRSARIQRGPARTQQQIVPDELITWLTINNTGYIGSGVANGSYTIELNDIVHPFNTTDILPNLESAAATWDPTGLQNILYNSASSTGFYFYYRVLAARLVFTVVPISTGDVPCFSIAPTNQGGVYGQFTTGASGPQGKSVIATTYNNTRSNTMTLSTNVKKIVGIRELAGATFTPATDGTYSTSPTNNMLYSINWYTTSNTSANIHFKVGVQYKVYFFGRVDTPLLESVTVPNVTRSQANCDLNASSNNKLPPLETEAASTKKVPPLIVAYERPANSINNANNIKDDYVDVKQEVYSLKNRIELLTSHSNAQRGANMF